MVKILSGPCLALSRSGVPESKYTFMETPHNSLLQSFRSISSDLNQPLVLVIMQMKTIVIIKVLLIYNNSATNNNSANNNYLQHQ